MDQNLVDRVQAVADLAGKPGREDDFAGAYRDLLGELTQAMKLMKGLAVLQIGWIRGQMGERGRNN
jgi:hypothetical protein